MGFTPIDESEIATTAPSFNFTPITDDEIAQPGPRMHPNTWGGYLGAAGDLISELPGNIWEGVKKSPEIAADLIKSTPQAAADTFNLVANDLPMAANDAIKYSLNRVLGTDYFKYNDTNYQRAENTLKGIATLGVGAAGGEVLGPVGVASGLSTIDQLFQELGIIPKTNPDDDLKKLEETIGTMMAFNTAAGAAKAPLEYAKNNFPGAANALERKSLGTRQSDYGTKSSTKTIETPERGVETYVKQKLDSLIESGELPKSRNPEVLSKAIDEKMNGIRDPQGNILKNGLRDDVNEIIQNFDYQNAFLNQTGQGVQVYATFPKASKMITDGKIPADKIATFESTLQKIQETLDAKSQGKLAYLQQQKIAYGKSYDPADAVKSNFDRAIYEDLKNTIEHYTPDVKPLNTELSKWETIEPIVNRSLTIQENSTFIDKAKHLGYTTGGVGGPALIGGAVGGPVGTAIGLGLGLTGKALLTPRGQALLARGLKNTASVAAPIAEGVGALKQGLKAGAPVAIGQEQLSKGQVLQNKPDKPSINNTNSVNPKIDQALRNVMGEDMYKNQPVKDVIQAVKSDPVDYAIAKMESNFNPKAKNPNSTASGLFQLIKKTAGSLGVEDVFDAGDNYDGYLKLKQDTIDKFDIDPSDYRSIYASHYLGETAFRRWINGEKLTAKQQAQVEELTEKLFPRLDRYYKEGQRLQMGVVTA